MENTRQRRSPEFQQPVQDSGLINFLTGKNNPLIMSLFVAGIAFILIGVIGWQVAKIFATIETQNLVILQVVGYVGILFPMLGSFFVYRRLQTIKTFWLVLMIMMYVAAEIVSFGLIFLVHNVSADWMTAFGFSGGMFILCGLVGYFCSWIQKLWKYIAILSVLYIVMIVVMLIVRFAIPQGATLMKDAYLYSAGILGVLTMFYVMFDVNRMKNFLADPNNPRGTLNMILFTAFRFLIDLVNLVWVFARLTFLNRG